ncbi:MAG: biotin/lipoyl-containing protein, partial [Planctomycetota bacterium]
MIEIKVPPFGESIQEVQVSTWLKQEGDWVRKDEDLVELESEKATQAFPAPADGVLVSIKSATGSYAKVGDVIAILDPSGKPSAGSGGGQANASSSTPTGAGGAQARVMPAAERLLQENKVSPESVTPTGPGGRILKEDVQKHVAAGAKSSASATASAQPAAKAPAAVTRAVPIASEDAFGDDGFSRVEEVKPMSM